MDAPSQEELNCLKAAGRTDEADSVMHWQSAYGLIIIPARPAAASPSWITTAVSALRRSLV